ncbi:hypothetical protein ACEPAF_1521 [Sanghuangporus sanghuang]
MLLEPTFLSLATSLRDDSFCLQQATPLFSSDPGSDEWSYMGNYEFKKSDQLAAAKFRQTPLNYRQAWVYQVLHPDLLIPIFSRIVLHGLLGRTPTEIEIWSHAGIMKERLKDFRGLMNLVFQEEIDRAFRNGIQKVNVWTVKCVGYDENYLKRALLGDPLKPENSPGRKPAEDASSTAQNRADESRQRARAEDADGPDKECRPAGNKSRLGKGNGKGQKI